MAQNLKPNRLDNRGGERKGSGRKPDEVPMMVFYRRVTKEQAEQLDALLKSLKKN